jgi:cytochrome P450
MQSLFSPLSFGITAFVFGAGWAIHFIKSFSSTKAIPSRQHAKLVKGFRSWDIFGIAKIANVAYTAINGTFISYLETSWGFYGDTHTIKLFGNKVTFTRDAANIKTILKSHYGDYYAAKGVREEPFKDLVPRTVGTTDGNEWKENRSQWRRHVRQPAQLLNHDFIESSFQHLVRRINQTEVVDMQPLVYSFGTDISHELGFGESTHCSDLQNQSPEEKIYIDALMRVTSTLATRALLGPIDRLFPRKGFKADCAVVKGYVRQITSRILSRKQTEETNGRNGSLPRETFLERFQESYDNPITLNHNLAMLVLAGEPMTISLALVVWLLSRNPVVYEKLRKSILDGVGYQKPTYDQLNTFTYLKHVLYECELN